MSWFKVDDKLGTNSKIMAAGNAAVGLWVRCGSWCAAHRSDGFVPEVVAHLYGSPREVTALVAAGLWHPTDGGWVMHDWLDYNPSAEALEARSRTRAEAGAIGGRRSATKRSKRQATDQASAQASAQANGQAGAQTTFEPPSRPVPSRPDPKGLTLSSSSKPVSDPPPDDDDEFEHQVIDAIAHLRCNGQHPKRPASYRRTIVANFHDEELPQLRAFLDQHPEARDGHHVDQAARVYEAFRTERTG